MPGLFGAVLSFHRSSNLVRVFLHEGFDERFFNQYPCAPYFSGTFQLGIFLHCIFTITWGMCLVGETPVGEVYAVDVFLSGKYRSEMCPSENVCRRSIRTLKSHVLLFLIFCIRIPTILYMNFYDVLDS